MEFYLKKRVKRYLAHLGYGKGGVNVSIFNNSYIPEPRDNFSDEIQKLINSLQEFKRLGRSEVSDKLLVDLKSLSKKIDNQFKSSKRIMDKAIAITERSVKAMEKLDRLG